MACRLQQIWDRTDEWRVYHIIWKKIHNASILCLYWVRLHVVLYLSQSAEVLICTFMNCHILFCSLEWQNQITLSNWLAKFHGLKCHHYRGPFTGQQCTEGVWAGRTFYWFSTSTHVRAQSFHKHCWSIAFSGNWDPLNNNPPNKSSKWKTEHLQCVCQKKKEKKGKKTRGKSVIMIKIADVKSHFSKGVSFGEFGTNFWLKQNSKFNIFTKIKNEFSLWQWTFLLPIYDFSGEASITDDETKTIKQEKGLPKILST